MGKIYYSFRSYFVGLSSNDNDTSENFA
jgi:hypothetical protein